jgi:hypothetical protein
MRIFFLLFSIWLAGGVLADSWGDRPDRVAEADMKAAYIYNFGAFMEWPESNRISFNICTLGDDKIERGPHTLGRALRVHRCAHRRREYDQHRRTASYRLDD